MTDDGDIGVEGVVLRDTYAPNQAGFCPAGVMGRVESTVGTPSQAGGAAQKTIYNVVADKNAVILVTLQGPAGKDVSVRYVNRRSATSFTVYLTAKAAKKVKFGWFIVN